ncbi:MAG: hypothetical protein PHQ43_12480 [Dehalococcoidales bacterium]|nr:hypothetical protein [Dehalococcoidales bacterium]
MKKYLFLFLIFLATPAFAGFESVIQYYNAAGGGEPPTYPTPAADWKMDSGALTTDSSGNGNTLTVEGAGSSTTIRIEGTGAGLFDATGEQAYRADGDLSAGFWGKSSGGSTVGTACSAFYSGSVAADGTIVGKYDTAGSGRSWRMIVDSATTSVEFWVGHSSGASGASNISEDSNEHATNIATSHWYAACIALDSSSNYTIRLYDCGTNDTPSSCSHTGTDVTGNFANAMSLSSSKLAISNNSDEAVDFLGVIDRTTVWSEDLTTGEMDAWVAELGI